MDNKVLNQLFVNSLNTNEGLERTAQETTTFIRSKIRELSFARKIVPPEYVTQADLQRSVNHDGFVKIVDIEPDSTAMVVNFRGNPNTNYLMGDRYEIPFFNISSEEFTKHEIELLAYEMPITEIVERNAVLDLQKIEDKSFLDHCDIAVSIEETKNPDSKLVPNVNLGSNGEIPKKYFKELFDKLDGDNLSCEVLLMDKPTFHRLMLYTGSDFGSDAMSEISINGYTYNTFMGKRIVVSNKVDLLRKNGKSYIYAFTSPDFLGKFYILQDAKFYLDKKKDVITFSCMETLGMGIGNTRSIAKMEIIES